MTPRPIQAEQTRGEVAHHYTGTLRATDEPAPGLVRIVIRPGRAAP